MRPVRRVERTPVAEAIALGVGVVAEAEGVELQSREALAEPEIDELLGLGEADESRNPISNQGMAALAAPLRKLHVLTWL